MLPWIRGWGGDVEVLAPPALRDRLRGEARRLARTYGWDVYRREPTGDVPGDASGDAPDDGPGEAQDEHQFFSDFFGG
jgi:hypothetical protein